jgi:hypothetical protein
VTPPTIRAELAAAVRAVNAAFNRLPVSARKQIDPRTDPVEDEIDAAMLADDRDRALAAIRAWRGYWLDRIARAGS